MEILESELMMVLLANSKHEIEMKFMRNPQIWDSLLEFWCPRHGGGIGNQTLIFDIDLFCPCLNSLISILSYI